jgi:hypothetical protein
LGALFWQLGAPLHVDNRGTLDLKVQKAHL